MTANAKLSTSVVNTLSDCVPEYLYNRPHWFIHHCVKRMRGCAGIESRSSNLSHGQIVPGTNIIANNNVARNEKELCIINRSYFLRFRVPVGTTCTVLNFKVASPMFVPGLDGE